MIILILDDESLARIGIKQILLSSGEDHTIIESNNGVDALEKYVQYKPQLVFVDIHMPGYSGLEFIRYAKQEWAGAKFVIVTCYSDYENMHGAIKLDVADYLLKSDLDPEKILALVDEIKPEAVRYSIQNEPALYKIQFKDELLSDTVGYGSLTGILENAGINGSRYYAFYILLRHRSGKTQPFSQILMQSIISTIEELTGEYFKALTISISSNRVFIFCTPKDDIPIGQHKIVADEFAARISSVCGKLFNITVDIGIDEAHDRTLIKQAYARALWANKQTMFFELPGSVWYANDSEKGGEELNTSNTAIRKLLKQFNYEDLGILLKDFKTKTMNRLYPYQEVIDFLTKVNSLLMEHIEEFYPSMLSFVKPVDFYGDFLIKYESFAAIFRELRMTAEQLVETQNTRGLSETDIIEYAKTYINENLNKNLGLKSVAEFCNLSPSYFSKLFKKTTGENFIKYCIFVRMEKAKRLMLFDDKLYNVAEKVGYKNYGYFSKLFKELYNKTPEEYRRELQKEKDIHNTELPEK